MTGDQSEFTNHVNHIIAISLVTNVSCSQRTIIHYFCTAIDQLLHHHFWGKCGSLEGPLMIHDPMCIGWQWYSNQGYPAHTSNTDPTHNLGCNNAAMVNLDRFLHCRMARPSPQWFLVSLLKLFIQMGKATEWPIPLLYSSLGFLSILVVVAAQHTYYSANHYSRCAPLTPPGSLFKIASLGKQESWYMGQYQPAAKLVVVKQS